MKVLVLGRLGSPLTPIIEKSGCQVKEFTDKIDATFLRQEAIEYAVSYGYRHIIKKPVIDYLERRIINLHISYLPWNRGADPNLWSILEDTPKGVTIHYMDEGLDTGEIIAQKEVAAFDANDTLASSYRKLSDAITALFESTWPAILQGKIVAQPQPVGGSYHRLIDKQPYAHLLEEKGFDTLVRDLVGKAIVHEPKRNGG